MSSAADETRSWYAVENAGEIPSPALLVYPERIRENIKRMIGIAGGPERLRPHVKTYKMAPVIKMQMRRGIQKFKCSTIAEAELTARCKAQEILLALQPVGPQIERLLSLIGHFPDTEFSTITDSEKIIRQLDSEAGSAGRVVTVWLDIDNGMHRTGIAPGKEAVELYGLIESLPSLRPGGLHLYDGHIHDRDPELRTEHCDRYFKPVQSLADTLVKASMKVPAITAGGTPTFPVHARRSTVELGPGTPLLWDRGYADRYPDLDFLIAAVLLARVVSKPGTDLLCLDLGYKAVGSEMSHPRILFPELQVKEVVNHSEEHLVLKTKNASGREVGDIVYGFPVHICPTVDRYDRAITAENGRADGEWPVEARKRKITI